MTKKKPLRYDHVIVNSVRDHEPLGVTDAELSGIVLAAGIDADCALDVVDRLRTQGRLAQDEAGRWHWRQRQWSKLPLRLREMR
jgi:hypothetical protein